VFSSFLFGAKYLAVLELEAVGLSKNESKILTQRLTSKMIELGDYTVVERASIDKILKEQKFQYSGCVATECADQEDGAVEVKLTPLGMMDMGLVMYQIYFPS